MLRLLLLVVMLSLGPGGGVVHADPVRDRIVQQLRDQGFREIRISRTFLGRTRIVATSPTLEREIVVNPVTGVILRDYWTDLTSRPGQSGTDDGSSIFNPRADEADDDDDDRGGGSQGSSGASGGGTQDDDDDDGGGSGGGGSGGGSGGDDNDDDDGGGDDSDDDNDDDD